MKSLALKITLCLLATIALAIAVIWFDMSEPNRKISSNFVMKNISKSSSSWETRIDLIGSVFEPNEARTNVESTLKKFGFSYNPSFRFYYADDAVGPDDLVWSADQGNMVCNMEWSVIAKYDELNQLLVADGIVSERGCL